MRKTQVLKLSNSNSPQSKLCELFFLWTKILRLKNQFSAFYRCKIYQNTEIQYKYLDNLSLKIRHRVGRAYAPRVGQYLNSSERKA